MNKSIALSLTLALATGGMAFGADTQSSAPPQKDAAEAAAAGNDQAPDKPAEKKKNTVTIKYDPENPQVTEFIPIGPLSYETVEQFCKPMLSETGTMGYMPEKQCVVIHDYRKNAAKVREFIESATAQIPDYSDVNIRVEISYQGVSGGRRTGIGASWANEDGSKNQIVIKDGKMIKPKNITVRGFDNSTRGTSNTTQFIVTRSGCPARIWAGKTIVDPSWLNSYKFRPLIIIGGKGAPIIIPSNNPEVVWANVGTSLYVMPEYIGDDMIDVEVFPVVSYLDGKGKKQAVRIESVSTKVTVRSGARIAIGGIVKGKNDFYSSFFGPAFIGEDGETSVLDMYLTATAIRR